MWICMFSYIFKSTFMFTWKIATHAYPILSNEIEPLKGFLSLGLHFVKYTFPQLDAYDAEYEKNKEAQKEDVS